MNVIRSENPMNECATQPAHEKRKDSRSPSESTIMFENYMSGNFNVGQMVNCSKGGMCFRTGAKLALGSEVFIGTDQFGYHSNSDVFRARVVWLREKPGQNVYTVGVRYC